MKTTKYLLIIGLVGSTAAMASDGSMFYGSDRNDGNWSNIDFSGSNGGEGSTIGHSDSGTSALDKVAVMRGEPGAILVLNHESPDDLFLASRDALESFRGKAFTTDTEAAIEVVKVAEQLRTKAKAAKK